MKRLPQIEIFAIIRGELDQGVTTAAILSKKTQMSVRSVYRYIKMMRVCGVNIRGDAGAGYMLRKEKTNG